MLNNYLESENFLFHRFNSLKRKEIRFLIEEKIKPKSSTSQNKRNEIKRKLNEKFFLLNRMAFRCNLFVKITFYYNDSNPPTTTNATKNILDLMHVNINQKNNIENQKIIRNRLPFYDDSQIKFLSVRQIINTNSVGASVVLEPLNNILEYAHIYSELKDDFEHFTTDNNTEKIDFEESINYPIDSLGYRIELFRRQKELLKNNELNHFYIDSLYNSKRYESDAFLDMLLTVIKYPLRISTEIPKDKEQKNKYKQILEEKINEFKDGHPIWEKLYGPVILTIFYQPTKIDNIKDIDNFAREIVVPCFEQIFNPPIRMFATTKEEEKKDKKRNYCHQLDGHIVGYDILELPFNDKTKKGTCIIGFHMNVYSDISASLIDKIKESILR